MKDILNTPHRIMTDSDIPNVTDNKLDPVETLREVFPITSLEIVKNANASTASHEGVNQMRANEPGTASDERLDASKVNRIHGTLSSVWIDGPTHCRPRID